MDKKSQLLRIFSVPLKDIISSLVMDFDNIQEIRLRVQSPLMVVYKGNEEMIGPDGGIVQNSQKAYLISEKEIRETMALASRFSLYAYEDEIRQGYMTLQGGHRVGVSGKVLLEDGKIKGIRYISFLNIRLAHQIKGCSDTILPYLFRKEEIANTLIVSPPGCGKTTLLRDLIRQISDGSFYGRGCNVGVVDERSEIAASYQGVPQNDVGFRTDVMDACPKAEGMMMLLRSMAPHVIAVDEIGSREDMEAIYCVMNCGCRLLATVHGSTIDDLKLKPVLRKMIDEKIFERYVFLGNRNQIGRVEAIFDAYGSCVYKNNGNDQCH